MANITIWHCGGCNVAHLSVGKLVLNFTREEFADFTAAVVDLNYSDWQAGEREHSIIDLAMSGREDEHAGSGMVH